jgi:hypothetical protein
VFNCLEKSGGRGRNSLSVEEVGNDRRQKSVGVLEKSRGIGQ